MCFNPHARVGRDLVLGVFFAVLGVSIHTPVWGVTRRERYTAGTIWSFNPHARVGRDHIQNYYTVNIACFNPHARVGRDV